MKSIFVFITLLSCLLMPQHASAQMTIHDPATLIAPVGANASQYSPYTISHPGWNSTLMYYCKNTLENNLARDRVWRAEIVANQVVNNQIVIDGTLGHNNDLACSPGVVIGADNRWHMYYVAANRQTDMTLYLYHAVADAPGINWENLGPIMGVAQPFPHYIESPSPFFIDGQYILYLTGEKGMLYRLTSQDGHTFSPPTVVFTNSQEKSQAGYVSHIKNQWYYTYSLNPQSSYQPPTTIWLSTSQDGVNWESDRQLLTVETTQNRYTHIWSPRLLFDNVANNYKLYYAANQGSYPWWGSNSSIEYALLDTPTPLPGDLNADGKVDIFDYQRLITGFGNPYTIFDYQKVISNFGR